VVALDAATGQRIWHFQTIHHDLWDYDLPCSAQPGNGYQRYFAGAYADNLSRGMESCIRSAQRVAKEPCNL